MVLRVPASTSNLGPGFDCLGVALNLYNTATLTRADGAKLPAGMIAETATAFFERARGAKMEPFGFEARIEGDIPISRGLGSSVAVRLGVLMGLAELARESVAVSREEILKLLIELEGHPDNAAACWLGGFVASAQEGEGVVAVSFPLPPEWRAVIAMPHEPLATTESRAVLPAAWPRRDVVANLQHVALLTAAFAMGRANLIARAMGDCLHQPYRGSVCPLLPKLLPLAGTDGIAGVALSGAGPAVLLLMTSETAAAGVLGRIQQATEELGRLEILICKTESEAARFEVLG